MNQYDLVKSEYFQRDSFFHYVPTLQGLRQIAPSITDKTFQVLNDMDEKQNIQGSVLEESFYGDSEKCTIFSYLSYYYSLHYYNINKIAEDFAISNGDIVLEKSVPFNLTEPYSFISQASIYGNVGDSYYIILLDETNGENRLSLKQYIIGSTKVIQFYNCQIFCILPAKLNGQLLFADVDSSDTLLRSTVLINDNAGYQLVELNITTTNATERELITTLPPSTPIEDLAESLPWEESNRRTFIQSYKTI